MNKKKLIKQKPYEIFPVLIKWLANNLTKSNYKETSYALRIASKVLTVLQTRGKPEAIKYCKNLRSIFLKSILSMDQEFNLGNQL